MSADALAQPIPVPAAMVPTPAIIAPTGAGDAANTWPQWIRVIRLTATTTLSAPKIQVDQRCTATSTACPSPETVTVSRTNNATPAIVSTGDALASAFAPNRIAHRERNANAAVVVLTVSQPSRDTSETTVGPMLPRTPNTARDNVSPGAPPRRPAIETTPTIANDPAAPSTATAAAARPPGTAAGARSAATGPPCQNTRCCTATRVAPSGSPRMLMFAANHTQ